MFCHQRIRFKLLPKCINIQSCGLREGHVFGRQALGSENSYVYIARFCSITVLAADWFFVDFVNSEPPSRGYVACSTVYTSLSLCLAINYSTSLSSSRGHGEISYPPLLLDKCDASLYDTRFSSTLLPTRPCHESYTRHDMLDSVSDEVAQSYSSTSITAAGKL